MFFVVCMSSMILSRSGIEALLSSGCSCWEPDSPDDMWLGNCFRRLGVPLTHSSAFHQVSHVIGNSLLLFCYLIVSTRLRECQNRLTHSTSKNIGLLCHVSSA